MYAPAALAVKIPQRLVFCDRPLTVPFCSDTTGDDASLMTKSNRNIKYEKQGDNETEHAGETNTSHQIDA